MDSGRLTPWVVEGSSRGRAAWNSPWEEVTALGLRAAILVVEEWFLVCVGILDYFIWSNTGKMEAVIAQVKGKYMRVVYAMERPTVWRILSPMDAPSPTTPSPTTET